VPIKFNPEPDETMHVWEFPKQGEEYICGVDISEGLEKGDASCAQVIRRADFKQVAVMHGWVEPVEFARMINNLGYYYNTMLLAVERNQSGITVLDYLRSNAYPNIYQMQKFDFGTVDATERLGWITSGHTRGLIVDALRDSIREGDLILTDPETLAELKTFVRHPKTKKIQASPGNLDDRVMALAIACFLHRTLSLTKTPSKYDSYFERREAESGTGRVNLGRGGY